MSELNLEPQQQSSGPLRQVECDGDDILNTGTVPDENAVVVGGNGQEVGEAEAYDGDQDLGAYCVGEKESGNEKLHKIATQGGALQIGETAPGAHLKEGEVRKIAESGEIVEGEVRKIPGSDIHQIGGDASATSKYSEEDIKRATNARDAQARLDKLAPDGIFRLENGRSSLAGADLRGADLSQYEHADGSKGYKIEVPKKGGAEGETHVIPLGEWLAQASKKELQQLVPDMVYQDVKSSDYDVTNFGDHSQAAIKNLKKCSKPYDNSPIDVMKDFRGYKVIDPNEPAFPDQWNQEPGKHLLSQRECHHKMIIQDRILLDSSNPHLAEMDDFVKDKMRNPAAVQQAVDLMIDGMMKPEEPREAITTVEDEAENLAREAKRKKEREAIENREFGDPSKKEQRVQEFFCGAFIAEWAERQEIKDAVNAEFQKFSSSDEREEVLRKNGELPELQLDQLFHKNGNRTIQNLAIYNEARLNRPQQPDATSGVEDGEMQGSQPDEPDQSAPEQPAP